MDELYQEIEQEYKKTIQEISYITRMDVKDIDKLLTDIVREYYNIDDVENTINNINFRE